MRRRRSALHSEGEAEMKQASDAKPDRREVFRQAAGVEARSVEGDIFVAARKSGTIHHLDSIASAAWRALAKPITAEELITLFQAAFPTTSKAKIARDVEDLLAFLEDNHLIVRIGKKPE